MKVEGLFGIILLGLMCLIGIFLIFLESAIPVLFAIILGGIFILFMVFDRKKKVKMVKVINNEDMRDYVAEGFRMMAHTAENAIRTADEIKEELKLLKGQDVKYVGSVKSDKFHRPSCRLAKRINSNNQVWFSTKVDALKQGFVECKAVEV